MSNKFVGILVETLTALKRAKMLSYSKGNNGGQLFLDPRLRLLVRIKSAGWIC